LTHTKTRRPLIKKHAKKVDPTFEEKELSDPANRYLKLQSLGNELRKKYGNEILGQLAIEYISIDRQKRKESEKHKRGQESEDKHTYRVAYLIDSLKHPDEVSIQRAVYRNMFFLFGIFCAVEVRRQNLKDENIKGTDAEQIMINDKKQAEEFGQKLIETLKYADIFINNTHSSEITRVERFVKLILGDKSINPTVDEYAMYIAQSAALRSSCLSRQIGAAILSEKGEIISTGYNDVPQKGGGLCKSDDGIDDNRCVKKWNHCYSDNYKDKIKKDINDIIASALGDKDKSSKITEEIISETRIKDLIEFSRAVHAEMEAILSSCRSGMSPKGGTLYCTTFPCHTCARHIISVGIKKLFFIEPYEKSLAMEMYRDEIELEPTNPHGEHKKVVFSHFEGVAPRQYINFYEADVRKVDGKGITTKPEEALPTTPEYLDAWSEFEDRVVKYLKEESGFY